METSDTEKKVLNRIKVGALGHLCSLSHFKRNSECLFFCEVVYLEREKVRMKKNWYAIKENEEQFYFSKF